MKLVYPALLIMGLSLAACGSSANAAQTDAAAAFRGNFASGELSKIDGANLTVSAATGDTRVVTSSGTTVSKQQTASSQDLAVGECATTVGQKDSTGAVNAVSVSLIPAVDGKCSFRLGIGAGGAFSPRPLPSASPRFQRQGPPRVSGLIQSVTPTSFVIQPASGAAVTVNISTITPITKTVSLKVSDLQVGECVTAIGQHQSDGSVAARTILITPAGPNGCTAPGRGFGGFSRGGGGGGFGGGFGGGGFAGGGDVSNT